MTACAKGRVERLWGTFQDRLTSELRLAGVQTMTDAQGLVEWFLPRFNSQFGVPAAQPGSAYRPVPAGFALEQVFCFKYERTVAADNTVPLGEHRLQLLASRERRSFARTTVEVHERLDGSLAVYYQGRQVGHKAAPAEAPVLRARGLPRAGVSSFPGDSAPPLPAAPLPETTVKPPSPKPPRPAADHPWRRPVSRKPLPSPPSLPTDVAQAVADLSEELHEPWASRKPSLTRTATLLAGSGLAPATFLGLLRQATDKTLRAQSAGRVRGRQVDGRPKLMAYFFAVLENELDRPAESTPLLRMKDASSPTSAPSQPALDTTDAPVWLRKYIQRDPSV